MARSIYIASPEGHTGKSTIALGLVDLFVRRVERVGIFRPVVRKGDERDSVLELLVSHDGVDLAYDDLETDAPENFQAGPNANPADPNVALDPDEDLPWPDPVLLQKWWQDNGSRFAAGTRHLLRQRVLGDGGYFALQSHNTLVHPRFKVEQA